MKKVIAFALVFVLLLGINMTAFAAGTTSPSSTDSSSNYTTATPADGRVSRHGLDVCNNSDDTIDTVPSNRIIRLAVGQAGVLGHDDKNAFMSAFSAVREIKDRLVKYFYWLNTNGYEKPDDFAYFKLTFKCAGENVKVSVNGKDVEVVHVDGNEYFAKLPELGAIAISCDQ